MSKDWVKDVGEFHRKMEYPEQSSHRAARVNITSPEFLEVFRKRKKHLAEELEEFQNSFHRGNFDDMMDALADLIYIAVGTARVFGVDLRPVWDEVQRANMGRVKDERHWKGIIKPEGWMPPKIREAIESGDKDADL